MKIDRCFDRGGNGAGDAVAAKALPEVDAQHTGGKKRHEGARDTARLHEVCRQVKMCVLARMLVQGRERGQRVQVWQARRQEDAQHEPECLDKRVVTASGCARERARGETSAHVQTSALRRDFGRGRGRTRTHARSRGRARARARARARVCGVGRALERGGLRRRLAVLRAAKSVL
eukprot:360570-Pleurochrysis_carterae.AAC.3